PDALVREWTLVTSPAHQLPGPAGPSGDSTEARSPSEWLLLLFWRQKWVIVLALLLAVGGGYAYLRTAKKYYVSTAKVAVKQINALSFTTSQGQTSAPGSFTIANSQASLMTSEAVLAIAAERLGKDEKGHPIPGKPPTSVTDLRSRVTADVDRTTEEITLSVKALSAADARDACRHILSAYSDYVLSPNKDPRLEKTYADYRDAADRDLVVKRAERDKMLAENGMAVKQGGDDRSITYRNFEKLSQQLSDARQTQIQARDQARAAKALGVAASQPADPVDDELYLGSDPERELQAILLEMNAARAQRDQLALRSLGAEHPQVRQIERRLASLRRQYVRTAEQWAKRSDERVGQLETEVEKAQKELNKVATISEQFKLVTNEIARLEGVRAQWDGKLLEARSPDIDAKVREGASDPTMDPREPSIPNAPKVMVIAVALGIVLGMVGAAGREWLDDRMRSAGEIKSSLGMPLLAVIPQSATKRSFSVSGQRVLLDPASDAAEAYRSLRTAIQFAAPEGVKTLMIASPNSGDGKTTLTTNLAIAIAQAGKRVCVVDADLRKPTIHDIFSMKTTLGLTTLLGGRSTLDGTIQKTGVAGLDVLPCGPVPANPAEVLNSQEFGATIDELADRYDMVLLDSPPVGAASDARVIAASCDATLLVLTAQKANRRGTEQARDALQGVGARIIGLVVNDVPGKSGGGYGTPKALRTVVPGLTSQEYDLLQARAK
ncbi:MAG TPA: polysaccharide biosynthesis tyrosine autokinase, partial [Humisphaera sp.]